jgi:hypothetical protein
MPGGDRNPEGGSDIPDGEQPVRDWSLQTGPNRSGKAAVEEQVPPSLSDGARGTNLRWRTMLVEEVGTGAQPVDVEEVRENLQLGWEAQTPSGARRLISGTLGGEHPICLPRAEAGGRGRVDGAVVGEGG